MQVCPYVCFGECDCYTSFTRHTDMFVQRLTDVQTVSRCVMGWSGMWGGGCSFGQENSSHNLLWSVKT